MKESVEQINQLMIDEPEILVDIEVPELSSNAADAHEWFEDDSDMPQAAVQGIRDVIKACLKVVKKFGHHGHSKLLHSSQL